MQLEVGYIGKIIRNEYMKMNLDAVPTMETLNGQTFAPAYAQVFQQMFFNGQSAANVTAQPFFEAALGGVRLVLLRGLFKLHRCPGFQEHCVCSRKPP